MDLEVLKATREHWYTAFFSGDTQSLKRIQHDAFQVTHPGGTQSRKAQISAITAAVEAGNWFSDGGSKTDVLIAYQQDGSSCVVQGKGFTTAGSYHNDVVSFCEHWLWDSDIWKVVSLTYG